MEKEIYGKKLVKYPKQVHTIEIDIEKHHQRGCKKIQVLVDENYNLTWTEIEQYFCPNCKKDVKPEGLKTHEVSCPECGFYFGCDD